MYAQNRINEEEKYKKDFIYRLLLDEQANDILIQTCTHIINCIHETYPNTSNRLKQVFNRCIENPTRVAMHGLLFFALFQEPKLQNIFKNKVNPQKLKHFTEKQLEEESQKFLNGIHTSLRAYVEDTRWHYCLE